MMDRTEIPCGEEIRRHNSKKNTTEKYPEPPRHAHTQSDWTGAVEVARCARNHIMYIMLYMLCVYGLWAVFGPHRLSCDVSEPRVCGMCLCGRTGRQDVSGERECGGCRQHHRRRSLFEACAHALRLA